MSAKRKFKIRRTFDKAKLAKLHAVIFPEDEFPTESDTVDWLVFDSSGKAVGFCMLTVAGTDPDDKLTAFMVRAGVVKDCQGHGLHRRMIAVRERFSRSVGFKTSITYTKIHNIQSSGYRLYIPATEYADKDCLYWRKDL